MQRFVEKIYSRLSILSHVLFEKNILIGEGTSVRKGFYLRTTQGSSINIGKNCFFNRYFSATAFSSITIGDNCIFGENVKIYDHNHKFNVRDKLIKEQGFNIEQIKIGNNVWIGSNVVILKGATIGNNSVIGAGCIIKGNIPEETIVVANMPFELEKIRY